jgi:hypothetical protein
VSVSVVHQSAYLSLSKLEGVIAKLEPLSEQHALVRFLHNVDNAKDLTGFVQELADAVMDYQVRAAGPIVIFTECSSRCRYNKQCTAKRGRSTTTLRTFTAIPRTS